jgi:lipase ATG15
VSTTTDIRSATVTRIITSTTVTTDASRTSTMSPPSSGQTSTCTSHKWFGLICADDPKATATGTGMPSPKPSPDPPSARPTSRHCVRRSLIGTCKEWRWDGGDGEWKSDL